MAEKKPYVWLCDQSDGWAGQEQVLRLEVGCHEKMPVEEIRKIQRVVQSALKQAGYAADYIPLM